jgi:hypothetical protein
MKGAKKQKNGSREMTAKATTAAFAAFRSAD